MSSQKAGYNNIPAESNLEDFVKTPEFDHQCTKQAHEIFLSSDENDEFDQGTLWSSDEGVLSATTVESSSPHDVSRAEASLYYAGVGPKGRGPKLIYRTSDDVFYEPSGPEMYKRLMRIVPVPDDHQIGQNNMWDKLRDQVMSLLDQRAIKVTSVDFVRFTWLDEHPHQETLDDDELEDGDGADEDGDGAEEEELNYDNMPPIHPVEDGVRHYTNPTIWVGVLPESLSGAVAHGAAQDILALLDFHQLQKIDIAFRESVYRDLVSHGPALFRPAEYENPIKEVIDNVSVALSLPIAGRKTVMQGTLGPYFRVRDKLYAITARHNLFPSEAGTTEYRYTRPGPKMEVLLMGSSAFTTYVNSIQALIGTYFECIEVLEQRIAWVKTRLEDGVIIDDAQAKLDQNTAEIAVFRCKIEALKTFYVDISKKFGKDKDRVIGFVCWSPPIGVGVPPHRYTRDLCVIELYKDKFKHMMGNILSLGPEMSLTKLRYLLEDHNDSPPAFKYPINGLLVLEGILTAEEIASPNSLDLHGHQIRRVIKRGYATNTTVGTVTRFMSYVRIYSGISIAESLELPILSHERETGAFSKGGDSGSLIVSPQGEFVALLTGGTNKGTDGSDITYSTPFFYVWNLVKEEFPGANLYFDKLEEFLADA
ncbi:hypothetical protein D9613_005528 [Agrocybe pediades]|uniref:Uncharacterized protein n=1 Tax=Agrocybe pediades TaxID=84607 RepID=A0A8H4QY96_9AGAR|nr:hypothetical protein D9613_005528 [Agrocybe pediades]